jgi:uncharacterized protein DUF6702
VVISLADWLRLAAIIGLGTLHPLHTTLTELSEPPGGVTVSVTIRAFTDDLRAAAMQYAGPDPARVPDSLLSRYVTARVTLRDATGAAVPLTWRGQRQTADVTWLELTAPLPRGLSGARFRNAMHTELYRDQVNIVQIHVGDRSESLLFTPGDSAKVLH